MTGLGLVVVLEWRLEDWFGMRTVMQRLGHRLDSAEVWRARVELQPLRAVGFLLDQERLLEQQ